MAAIDDLKSLQQMLSGGLTGQAAGVYGSALSNQNLAEGLSPEAMSAFRTQATSGINDQYQSAAQALNSQLLRRGAVGQGALPSSGGDISRAYQPLYSAMEAAKTKAATDTILANEAAMKSSLAQNRLNALNAASGVFGTYNKTTNDIADLETPNIWKLLGTSALSSLLSGGGGSGGSSGGINLGGLLSGGGTNGTGNFGVLGDVLGKLFGVGGDKSAPGIGPEQGPVEPPGLRDALTKGLELSGGGIGSLITQGLGQTIPEVGVEGAAGTVGGGIGSTITGALGNVGSAIGSAAGTVGHAAIALLSNPVTAVIGGAILAATAILKSQAHWEANDMTKNIQGPFGDNLGKIVNGFDQALASGQLTQAQAQQIRAQTAALIDDFNNKVTEFSKQGEDKKKVALQAMETMAKNFGRRADYPNLPSYELILGKMDREIAQLPGAEGLPQ